MPKQINVKLGFEADTSQAKKQIADLQKSLDGLLSSSINQGALKGFDKEISNAQQSILKLKTVIDNSLNTDTGRLDLSKFNSQLGNSGLTLTQLSKDMNGLGVDGQKAFLNLANSIVTAQKPMVESNKLLDNMWTALKNTARWQLSSSILHGFMGALQGAYGYAQDLNKSLTDIAIVTGRSVDQMAAFADQANKSAQALSVSTTAYTDAALIYYQQGLNDEEVKARTDITMQMSNVTGESAEHVSSYMTAIWNNFAEGSENLDHFADVITALGAATASSSEEIANGMQQFAAVADTVGLSYEYAATALATVVAQTRQSESTVGNSFRTIFSRLQGLKLGDTLEDGTNLNKYSEALAKVGVNIKDQNGDLKDMNTILDEIGAKWETLAKDQQIALAQTVGGVRQYTNLVALFDNWDKFQENLQIANGADGTLQKQADIYADSWEAAQKRVRAAWQALYQDLIDDKFFITILNGIEKILHGVDRLIDSIGGLPGVLSAVGVIVTKVFGDKIVGSLQNAQQQLKVFTGTAKAENDAMTAWTRQYLQNNKTEGIAGTGDLPYEDLQNQLLKQKLGLTIELREVYDGLNDAQKQYANSLLESVENQQKLTLEAKATAEAARKNSEEAMRDLRASASTQKGSDWLTGAILDVDLDETVNRMVQLKSTTKEYSEEYESLLHRIASGHDLTDKQLKLIQNVVDSKLHEAEANQALTNQTEVLDNETDQFNQRLQELVQGHHNGYLSTQELIIALEEEKNRAGITAEEIKKLDDQINKLKQSNQGVFSQDFAQNIVNSFKGISQLTMGLNSLKSAWDTFQNPDISGWQKLTSIITSLSFGLPALINGFKDLGGFKTILSGLSNTLNIFTIGFATNSAAAAVEQKKLALSSAEATLAMMEETKVIAIGNLVLQGYNINVAENIVNSSILAQKKEVLAAKEALLTAATEKSTVVSLANKAAMWEIYLVIGLVVAAIALWNKEQKEKIEQEKKQQQALEDSRNKANELITSYKELKDTLKSLADEKESIHQIAKNTDEWKTKVQALNAEMLKLIQSYNLVEGKDYEFKDGLIELTSIGLDTVNTEAARRNRIGQIANTSNTISSNRLNQQPVLKDIQDIIFSSLKDNQNVSTEDYQKFLNTDFLKEVGSSVSQGLNIHNLFKENGIDDSFANLILSNDELQSSIISLSKTIDTNTQTEKAAIKTDVYDQFGDISDTAATYIAEQVQDIYTDKYENFGAVSDQDYKDYASNYGWTQDDEGNWVDAEGNIKSITDEMVKGYMALNAAYEEAYGAFEGHIDELESHISDLQRQELTEKISTGLNGEELGNREEVSNWVSGLDDERLRIAAKLDIDVDDSLEEVQTKLEEEFNKNPVEFDTSGLSKKQAEEAQEEFESLTEYIQKASTAIDENGDKINELSDHLEHCKREASQIAKAIMRFDDAIQDVTENYEDWNRALKTGSMQEAAKAANQMTKAYGNLLDIDGSVLSSNFLENAENLDLMKAAIEGNEEAYIRLQEIANQDIITHLNLSSEDLTNFNNDLNYVRTLLDDQNFPDLEVGASLDIGNFLTALTDMVNAAHMTEEQATAYLANMGIDAEVTSVPAETQTVTENRKYWVPATYKWDSHTSGMQQAGNMGVDIVPTLQTAGHWEEDTSSHQEEASPTAFSLKVTSAHKSSGGGFKFRNASTGGGGAAKSSKGSGGKGGGSSKKPEVKEHKEHVKKEDRYHDIKEQLEDVRLEYDKVNKAKDRAFGKSKLKYLDQEIKKLKEEESLLKKYREEAEAYAKVDRAALEGTGMGAKFNENGALTNYEEVLANINKSYNDAIDTYNDAVDVYNASAQDEADKEILDRANKELDAQKKVYDDRLEKLKQYEDTYNLWQEQVWNELQKHWEEFDAKVEKVTTKIEIELDFNENDRKFLEWLYDNLGDEADYAADRIANLSKQMGEIESNIDIYKTGLKDIFALHNIDLDFNNLNADELVTKLQSFMKDNKLQSELTEEEAKSIRDNINGLMESYNELKDKADEVHENVLNAFDQFNERLERQMDIFDRLNKKLTNYQNIIDLTGRKTLKMTSNEVRKLNQAIIDNAQNELASAKKIADELSAERDRAKKEMERFQAIGDKQSFKYWENIFNEFDDKAADAMDNYYSAFEKTLELTEDAFKRSMELMKEDYNDALGDLNLISEQFGRQKELDELYLPDYKKYHELNKSTKELNKSLANTNNTLIKGKMNDLMDEINQKMENGVQISEYETEIIARRVALLQAEAELQNAKNAKSAVRMTRDNEGNFSYTYTADQNKISDAEENVSDKFYELLDYERNTQNEIQEQMIQKQQQFIDDIAEINERYKDDEEARVAALKELMTSYHQWMDFYASQDQILMFEMGRLRDEDWQDIERITGLKLADNENFISTWEDTIYGRLMPGYETAEDALDAWKDAAKITLDQANTDANNWEKEVEETFKEAGTDVETFKKKVGTELGQVQTESDKTRKAVETMVDDPEKGMKVKMKEAMDAADKFDTKYGTVMGHIQTEIGNTVAVLNEMLQKLGETYQEQVKLGQQAEATAASMNAAAQAALDLAAAQSAVGSGGNSGGGSTYVPNNNGGEPPSSGPKTYTYEVQDPVYGTVRLGIFGSDADAMAKFNSYFNAHSQAGWYKLLRDGVVISQKQKTAAVTNYSSAYTPGRGSSTMRSMAFASGGYTGDWGTTNGKLAILHQKEIVLNEDDTKNLLQSVDIVRGIADMLKTQQVPQTNINYSGVFAAAGAGALQQQVHIDASFPNVQSHSEIELALNNLINSASQYVNRK